MISWEVINLYPVKDNLTLWAGKLDIWHLLMMASGFWLDTHGSTSHWLWLAC